MKKDIAWLVQEINTKREKIRQKFESGKGTPDENAFNDGRNFALVFVLRLIHHLDEPEVLSQELPVIPKYVADWIVEYREKYDLYPALKRLEGNPFGWERIYTWYRTNTHDFVNAYLTGEYEVEGEPLYCVEDRKHSLLCKWESSDGWKVISTMEATEDGLHTDTLVFELTEQEIKDYDPRYWAFRTPV